MPDDGVMVYPHSKVRDSGLLEVDSPHQIYWEESGAASGIPAIYLHGGPGGTLGSGGYRTKFDPERFRIVGIEQRGCGRSTPHASSPGYDLSSNTTQHLIADIEAVREHLGIDRWVVNGVSWGSTLALAYAQRHPDRVLGVVLMAVTTSRRWEIDWITEDVGAIFPEAWHAFASHALPKLPLDQLLDRSLRPRIVQAYADLMAHADRQVREAASWAWAHWEDVHISIGVGGVHPDPRWQDDQFRHDFCTLTSHYWAHDGFCEPPILDQMHRLGGIPGFLIHGRRDVSGPVRTAWLLHRAWPGSELTIDEGDGHGGVGMVESWTESNSALADRLSSIEQHPRS